MMINGPIEACQRLSNCGASPPAGAVGPLGGHELIYFEWNMGARWNIYFDRHFGWLKYFTYRLGPVLAPNYKQHILSPAEVRKVCYSLAELCQIFLFDFILVEGAGRLWILSKGAQAIKFWEPLV
jgi:hypothetical protein